MNTKFSILGLGLSTAFVAAFAAGCADTLPPTQLTDARNEYQKATTMQGSASVASDLYDTREALKVAEQSFKDDGASERTKSLAYVADRKAIATEAKAQTMDALSQKKVAEANFNAWKSQQVVATRDELGRTQDALSQAQRDAAAARAKTNDLLSQIQGLKTQQTDRGLVLTLSGAVLFETGKSQLLPQATQKLKDVALALKGEKNSLDVIGYTDSTGTKEINDKLSKDRADAVRTYLVSQGVPGDQVRTEGMGPASPVASNATPEGRADNRRVEIVVENKK